MGNHARSGAENAAELPGGGALEAADEDNNADNYVNAQGGEDDEDDEDDDEDDFKTGVPKKRKSSRKNARLPDSPLPPARRARASSTSTASATSAATAAALAFGAVVVPADASIAGASAVAVAEQGAPVDAEAEESDADALMALLYRDSNATEADKVAAVRKFLETYPTALDTLLLKMERSGAALWC